MHMKKVYIIHRWGGSSNNDWIPYVSQELTKWGYEVEAFEMPNSDAPVISEWVSFLDANIDNLDEETYFIGHSIGCQAILRYLENKNTKIGGVFFVAPWFQLENLEDENSKQIAKPWIETPIDFEKIRKNIPQIHAVLSSNEPYGFVQENKKVLEEKLGAEVTVLQDRGHFTEEDGLVQFSYLVADFHKIASGVELLEVVKEDGSFDFLETRKKIHQEGLLHREIHIWFLTPQKEVVFQHRAKDKDTYPDKLDATVGGHVDAGMTYEETVAKECKEETGIDVDMSKVVFIRELQKETFDEVTRLTNNTIRAQYAYLFDGNINSLEVEEGKAEGFEVWKLDDLESLSEENQNLFIPAILRKDFLEILKEGWKLLNFQIELQKEFPIVYQWTDEPNKIYPPHSHKGKVSFFVTRGSVSFTNGFEKTITKGERFDVPPNILHTAQVGPEGCDYVVGQEFEGDS